MLGRGCTQHRLLSLVQTGIGRAEIFSVDADVADVRCIHRSFSVVLSLVSRRF